MTLPNDQLAELANVEVQREAAGLAQDGFTRIFRLLAEGDEASAELGLSVIEARARDWAQKGESEDARTMRLALLISGLDQWGLAWTQAFGLTALPGLTALLGNLRNPLDAQASARFEQQFAAIEAREDNAIDFKVELRRGIHLALWHAMVASEDRDQAERLLKHLGSMMLTLVDLMPTYGWRLVADALANIQLRCLDPNFANDPETGSLGQEMTQGLYAAVNQNLPADVAKQVMLQASQVVIACRQAQRAAEAERSAAT
ncbi:MAG TPA: hypothetical protein VN066_08355 [Rhodocyclaceae bacterium]|jgi:hypothetical protein|nr:hypothetical protein [Rhodocyclaceae bacterium]